MAVCSNFIYSQSREKIPSAPNPLDLARLYLERTLKIGGPSKTKSAPLVRHFGQLNLALHSIQLVMRCDHVISPISAV